MKSAASEKSGPFQAVVFNLDGKNLAVDIHQVQEIIRMVEITPVPKMPPFAMGVINLRGMIVPIINLREKLGLPDREPTAKTCIVLLHSGGQVLGFLVDDVAEVLTIPRESLQKPEHGPDWIRSDLFIGVGKLPDRLLVIIDSARLLSPKEERQLLRSRPTAAPE